MIQSEVFIRACRSCYVKNELILDDMFMLSFDGYAEYNQNPFGRWMKGAPKKGDLGLAKKYRGITLTSIEAKIYNALLRNRIEPKVDNILRKNQNGFRRK